MAQDTRTIKEKIHDGVLDGIVKAEYGPGDILTEKGLIEKYGVSKSPVRDALMTLCNEGVLKSIPRFGYQVVALTQQNITDLLEYRLILEKGALERSMETIDEEKIEILKKEAQTASNTDDVWKHWEINTRFHLLLMSFHKNQFMYQELERSMNILKRAYAQFYWSGWSEVTIPNDLKNHQTLIAALEEKDLEKAMACLEDDIHDFCIK